MASLVPVPAADIKASYHGGEGHYLELVAEGILPSWILAPFFKREPWTGGLFFSIRAYSGGLGPSHDQPFKSTIKVNILLPQPRFNSKTVLVETSLGTFSIPITYVDLPDAPDHPDPGTPTIFDDVLPPIKATLTGDDKLVISADVPADKGDGKKSYIEIDFDDAYFKLTNSGYDDKAINWTVKWAKFPEGKKNPQLINVRTSTWNGLLGPSAKWTRITQGYLVKYVLKG